MIGERIGAYQIARKLGEGGMGTVWLAEHGVLGRRAAIKMLNGNVAGQADLRARFFNEAKAAASIQEPGIVQIFDFGQHTDGRAYIVMELLEGEALDQRLTRLGRLSLPEALRIAQQVAVSLGAAHARGIVHRDLKPDNVYLVKDAAVAGGERTKLLDFGIAKLTGGDGAKTETSVVMGTPLFMSPEQCRGAGHVDQRSDVYSLGCLLFMMLTGRPPFVGEGPGDIIAMHLREVPPVPSAHCAGLPHLVDSLVLRCLEKEAARRYASGAEVADALAAIQAKVSGALPAQTPEPLAEGRRLSSAHATTLQPYSQQVSQDAKAPRGKQHLLWIAGAGGTALGVVAMVLAMGGAPSAPASQPPADRAEAPPSSAPVAPTVSTIRAPSVEAPDEIELEGPPAEPPPPAPTTPPTAPTAPTAPIRVAPPLTVKPGKPPPRTEDDKGNRPDIDKLGTAPAPDCNAESVKLEALLSGHYNMKPAAVLQASRALTTSCFTNKQLTRLLIVAIPAACALDQESSVLRLYALAPSAPLREKCTKYLAR